MYTQVDFEKFNISYTPVNNKLLAFDNCTPQAQVNKKKTHFRQKNFPSISYYFPIPKFFYFLEFHCPTWKK